MISITLNVLFLIKLYLFGAVLALLAGIISCYIFKPKGVKKDHWIILALVSYYGLYVLVEGWLRYYVLKIERNR